MAKNAPYQLLGRLRDEEYAALKADIEKRGVLVPVEVDENGEILDGHNRVEIAEKLNKPFKTITRRFKTEQEKREHVIKLNLARRHLDPLHWGLAFRMLLEARGVKRGRGKGDPHAKDSKSATVALLAEETGVPERTAKHRLAQADFYDALPTEQRKAVDKGEMKLREARRAVEQDKPKPKIKAPKGTYSCIVVDPPWPMQKIDLEVRPNQADLGYKTMSLDEIRGFDVVKKVAAPASILFLWTTQRFLPDSFSILEAWGFKYLLVMVWHKSGGFNPFNLPQYNCEFVVVGRKKGLAFTDTKAFSCCFTGKRRAHSQKPVEFYDLIRRVTPGKRLDMFSREAHEGFEQYGDETGKFS